MTGEERSEEAVGHYVVRSVGKDGVTACVCRCGFRVAGPDALYIATVHQRAEAAS